MKPLLLLLFCFCLVASAQAAPQEVPKGSDLRAELFDLARPKIEKMAGRSVRFAGSLRQLNGWAFFQGAVVDENGANIRVGEGESPDTAILWKQKDGEWVLVKAVAGFTDVIYLDWPSVYGAPKALLFPEG